MTERAEIAAAVEELVRLRKEYFRLEFDEDNEEEFAGPASALQIHAIQERLGRPVPPTYRAFLELHGGWKNFAADSALLSAADYEEGWVRERLADLNDLFGEFESDNPVQDWGFPILLGATGRMSLFLDKRSARPDGELDYVYYDATEEQERFGSFLDFLNDKITTAKSLIERTSKKNKKKKPAKR